MQSSLGFNTDLSKSSKPWSSMYVIVVFTSSVPSVAAGVVPVDASPDQAKSAAALSVAALTLAESFDTAAAVSDIFFLSFSSSLFTFLSLALIFLPGGNVVYFTLDEIEGVTKLASLGDYLSEESRPFALSSFFFLL